jgi:hypothetical protein
MGEPVGWARSPAAAAVEVALVEMEELEIKAVEAVGVPS